LSIDYKNIKYTTFEYYIFKIYMAYCVGVTGKVQARRMKNPHNLRIATDKDFKPEYPCALGRIDIF